MERLPGIARDRSGPGGRDVAYGRSTVVAMILIFGFRVRGTNVGEGEFFCPHCGADRHYVMRALRRWFTFFFIPIFPSGKELGRQVVCSTCNTAFREDVLNAPTSSALSDHIRNAMRVASVAMLRAGGETSAARAAASDAIRATGFTDYDDATSRSDLASADVANLAGYLAPLASGLELAGKENFVSQVATIGLADGTLTPAETELLDSIGTTLGLSPAHVRGIVVTAGPGARSTGSPDGFGPPASSN
jgi:tellurite resistance protein